MIYYKIGYNSSINDQSKIKNEFIINKTFIIKMDIIKYE